MAGADVPAGSAHWLRHCFASQTLPDSGADLRLVQQGLGHSSPAVTSQYLHLNQGAGAGEVLAM